MVTALLRWSNLTEETQGSETLGFLRD